MKHCISSLPSTFTLFEGSSSLPSPPLVPVSWYFLPGPHTGIADKFHGGAFSSVLRWISYLVYFLHNMHFFYTMLNIDSISSGFQLLRKYFELDWKWPLSPPLALSFFLIMDFLLFSANVSRLQLGLLHSGYVSLLPLYGSHMNTIATAWDQTVTGSIHFSCSLYCKSGVGAKADSIIQTRHHFKTEL